SSEFISDHPVSTRRFGALWQKQRLMPRSFPDAKALLRGGRSRSTVKAATQWPGSYSGSESRIGHRSFCSIDMS
ncbi:MAG: hypothetical protein ACPL7J_11495, partial [Desulfomonilaceae bacterium]